MQASENQHYKPQIDLLSGGAGTPGGGGGTAGGGGPPGTTTGSVMQAFNITNSN